MLNYFFVRVASSREFNLEQLAAWLTGAGVHTHFCVWVTLSVYI